MDEIFSDFGCKWSLFDEISNKDHINLPEYSQLICTALQIAIVELLADFGIVPSAVVGQSLGEISAAYAVGALSQESAGKIAVYRGLLAGRLKTAMASMPGAMMAVNLGESDFADYLANISCAYAAAICFSSVTGGRVHVSRLAEPQYWVDNLVNPNISLEHMSYAEWNLTVRSKVGSSWNLHKLLPGELDFFVFLSSIDGTHGAAAQSNYAAGCTFQDGVARYRVNHSQKAVSLDLGWMRAVGAVAELDTYTRVVESAGSWASIEEEELLAILRVYCMPSRGIEQPSRSQLVIGARTAADLIGSGKNPTPHVLSPMFSIFAQIVSLGSSGSQNRAANDVGVLLQQASNLSQRREIVVQEIVEKLSRSLSVSPGDIDAAKCLNAYGIDSLVAVEMRNWISQNLHATIAVFDLLSNLPITGIATMIIDRTALLKQD
ncbi:Reducing polyketide synthase pksF [Paramyrothecium foliicola]|nr:Reducing polyketide synthase pksF [Paramyrothecium foliicola]